MKRTNLLPPAKKRGRPPKSLGQIAFEALGKDKKRGWGTWTYASFDVREEWESIAAAVEAAVRKRL